MPVVPGYRFASRQNLSSEVPKFIVIGQTTRADVLVELGEADGAATDESWLSYGSAYSYGGVLGVMAAGSTAGAAGVQTVEYRRLVLRFDEDGRVAAASLERKTCGQTMGGMGDDWGESRACLDPEGSDLPPTRPGK